MHARKIQISATFFHSKIAKWSKRTPENRQSACMHAFVNGRKNMNAVLRVMRKSPRATITRFAKNVLKDLRE